MLVCLRDRSVHTETEVADQTCNLTQSLYTQTRPTSPSTDSIAPSAWQGCHWRTKSEVTGMTQPGKSPKGKEGIKPRPGARLAQLVVLGLAIHSVAGSILLWGHFLVETIFPLELTWVQAPFPPKNSFGWEYKPRSSLCTHAFHCTDSKDPDVHVLDGWMPATKPHPARTIHKDGMWLP